MDENKERISPVVTYALYGENYQAEELKNSIKSVQNQKNSQIQIMLPDGVKTAAFIGRDENIIFISAEDEDDFWRKCIVSTKTPFFVPGDKKITYRPETFERMVKCLLEKGMDFVAGMVWHCNYDSPQPVVMSQMVYDFLQKGYEYNEILLMDNLLANKMFYTGFLKAYLKKENIRADRMQSLYKRGCCIFLKECLVLYEDKEETYMSYVLAGTAREYVQDGKRTLEDAAVLRDNGSVWQKMLDYPLNGTFDGFIKKLIFLFRRLKVKNRVLFISLRSNGELEGNAKALYPYIDGKKTICARQLPHNRFRELQMYYKIAKSRVIITDDYVKYFRYYPLKDSQRLIQLWHAGGAFKKFGRRGTARTEFFDSAAHAQYNMVTVSSEFIRSVYADAFHLDIRKVTALGVPRTDIFFDKEAIEKKREKIYKKYPAFRNKKILLYAPTFRDKNQKREEFYPEIDFEQLSGNLLADQLFVICPHPVMKNRIVNREYANVFEMREFSTTEMMFVSDLLITDYSSVIFEYALLGRPMVFYCYDREEYDRGFYLNYSEDLPGEVYTSQEELTNYLCSSGVYEMKEKYRKFVDRYMSACDGKSCERIAAVINSYMEEM